MIFTLCLINSSIFFINSINILLFMVASTDTENTQPFFDIAEIQQYKLNLE